MLSMLIKILLKKGIFTNEKQKKVGTLKFQKYRNLIRLFKVVTFLKSCFESFSSEVFFYFFFWRHFFKKIDQTRIILKSFFAAHIWYLRMHIHAKCSKYILRIIVL